MALSGFEAKRLRLRFTGRLLGAFPGVIPCYRRNLFFREGLVGVVWKYWRLFRNFSHRKEQAKKQSRLTGLASAFFTALAI